MLAEGCQCKLWTEWRLWQRLIKINGRKKNPSDIFNIKKMEQKEEWQTIQLLSWTNSWNSEAGSCRSPHHFADWLVIWIRNIFWHTLFCKRISEHLIIWPFFFVVFKVGDKIFPIDMNQKRKVRTIYYMKKWGLMWKVNLCLKVTFLSFWIVTLIIKILLQIRLVKN